MLAGTDAGTPAVRLTFLTKEVLIDGGALGVTLGTDLKPLAVELVGAGVRNLVPAERSAGMTARATTPTAMSGNNLAIQK